MGDNPLADLLLLAELKTAYEIMTENGWSSFLDAKKGGALGLSVAADLEKYHCFTLEEVKKKYNVVAEKYAEEKLG